MSRERPRPARTCGAERPQGTGAAPSPGPRPGASRRSDGRSGRLAGPAVLALALFAVGLPRLPADAAATPDPAEILRRAEDVRSPDVTYAADFTIAVLDDFTPGTERKAYYTMIARGKDDTMALMRTPTQFYGGTLLIHDGAFWLLLPKAARPFQLSAAQVLSGDTTNGDLARANLLASYEPRLDGEETVDGEACWRLVLTRTRNTANYPRMRCWITKSRFRPKTFEYYGMTGSLIKTARFGEYRKGPIGVRPMRIDYQDRAGKGGRTSLLFTALRKIDASPINFTPEGMIAFRDAALASRKGEDTAVPLADILAALAAGKS